MKTINKSDELARLGVFRAANPEAFWEKSSDSNNEAFRCCSARYNETQQHLRTDQGNICAYCEQDLLSGTNGIIDDCRIEHFHPKSKRENGEPNWALEWSNLLTVCCGGNQSKIVDAGNRFDTDPNDYSCDVPKDDKILDTVIYNPLHLPHGNIWQFKRSTGEILVNEEACNIQGLDIPTAIRTIVELNLNTPRLKRARRDVLNKLNEQIGVRLHRGQSIEQARHKVASSILIKNQAGDWPSFFSAIRKYLGDQAEGVLRQPGCDL